MLISVIVPTYNRVDDLKQIIQLLLNQKTQPWFQCEIIIVNNNSMDETEIFLQEMSSQNSAIRSFKETKQGTGYALNAGITHSKGDIVVFNSDDLLISEDRILNIACLFRDHPEVECATGKVLPVWNSERPRWYSDHLKGVLVHVDYGEQPKEVNYCVGANSCFRRSIFDRFGLFDTDWRFEDVHFARRIRGRVKINYFPELVVYHPVHHERMNKTYFKHWYSLAGAFEGHDVSLKGRGIIKVELWRFKEAARHAIAYLKSFWDEQERFYHECELNFFMSLLLQRNGLFTK